LAPERVATREARLGMWGCQASHGAYKTPALCFFGRKPIPSTHCRFPTLTTTALGHCCSPPLGGFPLRAMSGMSPKGSRKEDPASCSVHEEWTGRLCGCGSGSHLTRAFAGLKLLQAAFLIHLCLLHKVKHYCSPQALIFGEGRLVDSACNRTALRIGSHLCCLLSRLWRASPCRCHFPIRVPSADSVLLSVTLGR